MMREWSHIILFISLVPRMPALVGKIPAVPTVKILDTQDLFAQIDDFFKKLACPESLLKPKETGKSLPNESINTQVDLATRIKAQVRFELINAINAANPELGKKCSNIGLLNESLARPRTLSPLLDIWKMKLCFLQMVFGRCAGDYRPSPPQYIHPSAPSPPSPPPSGPSVCIPFDKVIMHPDGRWEKLILLNCTTHGQGSMIMPMPSSGPAAAPISPPSPGQGLISPPSPNQGLYACTPFEQFVVDANGKTQKVKQLHCTYPNQTSIIRPMPESENNSVPQAPQAPTSAPQGGQIGNLTGWDPKIVISQNVKVDTGISKPTKAS